MIRDELAAIVRHAGVTKVGVMVMPADCTLDVLTDEQLAELGLARVDKPATLEQQ